jgi:hypothetical protein
MSAAGALAGVRRCRECFRLRSLWKWRLGAMGRTIDDHARNSERNTRNTHSHPSLYKAPLSYEPKLVRKTWAKYDTTRRPPACRGEACAPTCNFQFIHRNDTGAVDGMLLLSRPLSLDVTRARSVSCARQCHGDDIVPLRSMPGTRKYAGLTASRGATIPNSDSGGKWSDGEMNSWRYPRVTGVGR